ncbi:hypothetical protein GJAV_G00226030, partial [Gymnothorax javanicus]
RDLVGLHTCCYHSSEELDKVEIKRKVLHPLTKTLAKIPSKETSVLIFSHRCCRVGK